MSLWYLIFFNLRLSFTWCCLSGIKASGLKMLASFFVVVVQSLEHWIWGQVSRAWSLLFCSPWTNYSTSLSLTLLTYDMELRVFTSQSQGLTDDSCAWMSVCFWQILCKVHYTHFPTLKQLPKQAVLSPFLCMMKLRSTEAPPATECLNRFLTLWYLLPPKGLVSWNLLVLHLALSIVYHLSF